MYTAYISGALTGVPNLNELKHFYEGVANACREVGLTPYVPHLRTDPIKNGDVTPEEVFNTDKKQVFASDILISYVGVPSLGVGMEIAYAETKGLPIVLLSETGKKISRFPRGVPTLVAQIVFESHEQAYEELKTVLQRWQMGIQTGEELHIEVMSFPGVETHRVTVTNRSARLIVASEVTDISEGVINILSQLHERGISPTRVYLDPFSGLDKSVQAVWQKADIYYEYQS